MFIVQVVKLAFLFASACSSVPLESEGDAKRESPCIALENRSDMHPSPEVLPRLLRFFLPLLPLHHLHLPHHYHSISNDIRLPYFSPCGSTVSYGSLSL